ncbi:BaiN/RdsA family NAD(P)/FAD-dependent oxidoreductase [Aureibacter tunicatorum]|uniref:Flavoprotein n=1 Tax=Aureibacter tunicatorum TaxID=866807 RepID=A0AAE3XPP4_9BACT|nr:NAD(P)/FAD-dependent oxidoreductase [Aureibacter tunicatorum]MDR6239759.1 hypothetical protein [Aureibacter tunicatorum]BDD04234.1 flavoprotein [Aureibacter tunicatorum]
MSKVKDIVIVGGGAAGFFAASILSESLVGLKITILEKTSKVLSKVKVSGGGRCNVTNSKNSIGDFSKAYPRGKNQMKKMLKHFSNQDMVDWLEGKGVSMKVEEDGRIFPFSNSSQSIIDCFTTVCEDNDVELLTGMKVENIKQDEEVGFVLSTNKGDIGAKHVLVATGGFPSLGGYDFLADLDLNMIEPIPSLFTFNIPKSPLKFLQGLSVENARVKVLGTKLEEEGAVLVTHWGLSGPGILKLSAYGAKSLSERDYRFGIHINWLGNKSEDELRNELIDYKSNYPSRKVSKYQLFGLPKRLWDNLLSQSEISEGKIWSEVSKKSFNKLVENIYRMELAVDGKTTFKEEFVTCGGVDMGEIDVNTMQSKKYAGLYFAGEILNVDGITGGYNFQNAWSGAFIAAKNIIKENNDAE